MSAARRARRVVLSLLVALACCVLLWQRASLLRGSIVPLLWLVPLLPALPGLVRGKRYTYAWSTLVITGYIALALTEVVANPFDRLASAAMLFTAFAVFVALVAYLRLSRIPESPG